MNSASALRHRRQDIRRELDQLESQMGGIVRGVERDIRSRLSVTYYVKRYPIGTFLASAVSGLVLTAILGHKGSGRLLKRTVRTLAGQWLTRYLSRYLAERMP